MWDDRGRGWCGGLFWRIWLQLVVCRCLAGFRLPCGCLVGVYETAGGQTIRLVDAQGMGCPAGAIHAPSALLPRVPADGI